MCARGTAEDRLSALSRSWHGVDAVIRFFGGLAPIVYLATALPTVIFLTVLTPPFQTPDETNHFRRAVQLLRGEIVGHDIQSPGWSGAELPKNVVGVAESFSYLIDHPKARFSPTIMHDTLTIPWNWSDREFTSFANTVIYPPFFYMPAVVALAVARSLGWNVLDAYELARLTTGVVAVLIATMAVGFTARGRALMFVILSLPTTLYLFASVSQDALLIACVSLAMSLCSRAAALKRPLGVLARPAVTILLGAAMAARPPYVFLLAVLVTPVAWSNASRSGIWPRIKPVLPIACALAIGLGWIVFGARPSQTPMRLESGVSIPEQARLILLHPALFPTALAHTLSEQFRAQLEQAIGVLGWSETFLPPAHYLLAAGALAIAVVVALLGRRDTLPVGWGLMLLAAYGLAFVSLYGVLYLSWTPVGAIYVDGFQGRYLLPASTLLVLALPATGALKETASSDVERMANSFRSAAWIILCVFVAASDLWLPREVFARYYG